MIDAPPVQLEQLVDALGPELLRIFGPSRGTVTSAAPIDQTANPFALSFCSNAAVDGAARIRMTASRVVLCGEAHVPPDVGSLDKTLLVVREPRLSFLRLVRRFFAPPPQRGIHATASIDPRADVHPDTYVGPQVYIGRAQVGAGTVLHAHVVLYDGVRLGCNVTIHAGTVVGADGYGYERNECGELEKFPHVGGVLIEDDVEIGANACIDRGTLGDTIVRRGAKIDNLVHIAHNVVVGRNAAVIAHAMVGGSTRIGDDAWVAPSASLRDGLTIGRGAMVGLAAVVVKDVPDGETVMGVPARPAAEYRATLAAIRALGLASE